MHRPKQQDVAGCCAVVIPFPSDRRPYFVDGLARQMLRRDPSGEAQRHLTNQLARQRVVMLKKGISDAVIAREIARLDAAVWAAVRAIYGGRRAPRVR